MKQSRRSYAAERVLASPQREERLGGSEYRQVGKRGYERGERKRERKKGKKRRKKLDRE